MATELSDSIAPGWVKPKIFVDVLKESVTGFSKIKNFKVYSGSAAGENYGGVLMRVNIKVELRDGKEKSVSYMLKVPCVNLQKEFYEVERRVYQQVVPEMEQLYRDVGVEVKFGAKSFEFKNVKSHYVLLEDLAPHGFKNMNRIEGLDQPHTESALRKLSQLHAASAVRVATKGPYPKEYSFKDDTVEFNAMKQAHNAQSQIFLECYDKYVDKEEYLEFIKAIEPHTSDIQSAMHVSDSTGFNVLNHGDFWSNNIMFSHDFSGKIKGTYLIDYQRPKYGTVSQDLYFFLLSSTKYEEMLSKFDYFVKFYHDNLVEHLKLLKYSKPIPTLRDIHISLIKYGYLGYDSATTALTAVLVDPTEAGPSDNSFNELDDDAFDKLLYCNSRYKKHMKIIMPWLLYRGAFGFN